MKVVTNIYYNVDEDGEVSLSSTVHRTRDGAVIKAVERIEEWSGDTVPDEANRKLNKFLQAGKNADVDVEYEDDKGNECHVNIEEYNLQD